MQISRRTSRWALAAAVAGLGLAACSNNPNPATSKLPPAQAVSQSFSSVTAQPSLEMRISVDITAAQAQQLGHGALNTGSLLLAASTGHGENLDSAQAATDSADTFDLGLQFPSGTPLEMRLVGGNLYLHADLAALDTDLGKSPSGVSKIQNFLAQADAFAPGLGALAKGQWVEASARSLQSVLGSSSPTASLPGEAQKLLQNLEASLQANSSFQDLGNQSGRTEYAVTVRLRGFLSQFLPALQSQLDALIPAGLGGNLTSTLGQEATKVPAGPTAVADVFVAGNRIQEADVDLAQFASGKDRPGFPVPLKAVFSPASTITAPAGAVMVDLSKLSGLLGGKSG